MSSPQPAGWYPDPSGVPGQRYFDGTAWTENRAPAMIAPPVPPKSSAVAGLLQLFFGWLGLGRFYLGYSGVGAIQLILGLLGLITSFVFIGLIIIFPLAIWTFIEAIMMFAGGIKEKGGRPTR